MPHIYFIPPIHSMISSCHNRFVPQVTLRFCRLIWTADSREASAENSINLHLVHLSVDKRKRYMIPVSEPCRASLRLLLSRHFGCSGIYLFLLYMMQRAGSIQLGSYSLGHFFGQAFQVLQCRALRHDADERLCAGGADQDSSHFPKFLLCCFYCSGNPGVFIPASLAANADVDEHLRETGHEFAEAGQWQPAAFHSRQKLKCRHQTVPCRTKLTENDMPGLLATQRKPIFL